MAYGAEPAGVDGPAHTIYVWPSRELTAKSWYWPASWHEAFQHAAGRIGLAVAMCVLEGQPLGQRKAVLRLSMGCVRISIRRKGASIFVNVHEFTGPETPGPDTPGPDGGARQQPSSVDGLVLGLRGSGRSSYLVVFHGYMPPVPVENSLSQIPALYAPALASNGRRTVSKDLVAGRQPSEAWPAFSDPRLRRGMAEVIQGGGEMNSFARHTGKLNCMKLNSLYSEIILPYSESAVHLHRKVRSSGLLWPLPSLFSTLQCRYLH
jgi:hypothetical protein